MSEFLDPSSLINLNNINSSIRRKRISTELKILKNNYQCVNLTFNNDLDSLVLIIYDNIIPNLNSLSFILPNEYPFKPPKVIINGQNYINLLKMYNNPNNLSVLKSLTNRCCLCCNTIVSRDNWSPSIKFHHVISEINENLKIIEKILLKMSFDKFKLLLHYDYRNIKNFIPFTIEKHIY